MRILSALAIVLLTTTISNAGVIVRAWFDYDSLGVADHQIASVALYSNGAVVCEDNTPDIAVDGTYSWSCPERPFPPGDYQFFIRVTSVTRQSTDSEVAMGTIPPIEEPPVPEMPRPVLQRIEIERTEDGFFLTIRPA